MRTITKSDLNTELNGLYEVKFRNFMWALGDEVLDIYRKFEGARPYRAALAAYRKAIDELDKLADKMDGRTVNGETIDIWGFYDEATDIDTGLPFRDFGFTAYGESVYADGTPAGAYESNQVAWVWLEAA